MFIENGIIPILGCKHISEMQRKKKKREKNRTRKTTRKHLNSQKKKKNTKVTGELSSA